MNKKIVLASASPRRKQLLEWAEVDFEVITEPTDEHFPQDMNLPEAASHVALQKALAIKSKVDDNRWILAADTVVVLQNKILGKPTSKADAINMLTLLQGQTHEVITGVAIVKGQQQILFYDITEVTFNTITPQQIEFYVDKYKPYDKAGAYAIQEWIGVIGIKSIRGDFYNVMGLPVSRVVKMLGSMGY